MSCFVVEKKSIDNIINTLQSKDFYALNGKYALYNTTQRMKWEQLERFAREIWICNHKAFRKRYKENQSGFEKYRFLNFAEKPLSPFQLLKSMECLSYQCSEFAEDPPPLVLLDKIIDELRKRVIDNLPAYKAAKWE